MFLQNKIVVIAQPNKRYRLVESNQRFFLIDCGNYKKIATYFPALMYYGIDGYELTKTEANEITEMSKQLGTEKEIKSKNKMAYYSSLWLVPVSVILYSVLNNIILSDLVLRVGISVILVTTFWLHAIKLKGMAEIAFNKPLVKFYPKFRYQLKSNFSQFIGYLIFFLVQGGACLLLLLGLIGILRFQLTSWVIIMFCSFFPIAFIYGDAAKSEFPFTWTENS
ncbi:hypothetical protein [Latilactobacillus fragifolii]|uniref:hypothetical protein n=1 Tax=Latilactobacillus fragifolii TaxID=2814244 RepID=UPI001ABB4CBD|nr:hypothetical protein [Latilactobacillus fragifolii]